MSLDTISANSPMSAVFIGNESLLIQCATLWRDTGGGIAAIVTRSPEIARWATEAGHSVIASDGDLATELSALEFDWLLSVANLDMLAAI